MNSQFLLVSPCKLTKWKTFLPRIISVHLALGYSGKTLLDATEACRFHTPTPCRSRTAVLWWPQFSDNSPPPKVVLCLGAQPKTCGWIYFGAAISCLVPNFRWRMLHLFSFPYFSRYTIDLFRLLSTVYRSRQITVATYPPEMARDVIPPPTSLTSLSGLV